MVSRHSSPTGRAIVVLVVARTTGPRYGLIAFDLRSGDLCQEPAVQFQPPYFSCPWLLSRSYWWLHAVGQRSATVCLVTSEFCALVDVVSGRQAWCVDVPVGYRYQWGMCTASPHRIALLAISKSACDSVHVLETASGREVALLHLPRDGQLWHRKAWVWSQYLGGMLYLAPDAPSDQCALQLVC